MHVFIRFNSLSAGRKQQQKRLNEKGHAIYRRLRISFDATIKSPTSKGKTKQKPHWTIHKNKPAAGCECLKLEQLGKTHLSSNSF